MKELVVMQKIITIGERVIHSRATYEKIAQKATEKGRNDDLAIVRREMNNKVNQPALHNADRYWGALANIIILK